MSLFWLILDSYFEENEITNTCILNLCAEPKKNFHKIEWALTFCKKKKKINFVFLDKIKYENVWKRK